MRFYFMVLVLFLAVYVSAQSQESYEDNGEPDLLDESRYGTAQSEDSNDDEYGESREKRQCLGHWAECNEDFGDDCCAGYGCHQPLMGEVGNCRPRRY